VQLGNALMGYGDIFVAALLGALLARSRGRQLGTALLAIGLGLAFDLLFFAVNELPATVPCAVALLVSEAFSRRPVRGDVRALVP
jgi:hypothetical protein